MADRRISRLRRRAYGVGEHALDSYWASGKTAAPQYAGYIPPSAVGAPFGVGVDHSTGGYLAQQHTPRARPLGGELSSRPPPPALYNGVGSTLSPSRIDPLNLRAPRASTPQVSPRWTSSHFTPPSEQPDSLLSTTYRHPAATGRTTAATGSAIESPRVASHGAPQHDAAFSSALASAAAFEAALATATATPCREEYSPPLYMRSPRSSRVMPLPMREHVSSSGFSSAPFVSLPDQGSYEHEKSAGGYMSSAEYLRHSHAQALFAASGPGNASWVQYLSR